MHEMQDVYDAEHQILEALPLMAQAVSSQELRSAFEEHRMQTEGQVRRLEQAFQMMGQSPERKTCKGIQGLIREAQELMQEGADADVLDAGLIAAAQKVEHYEMAAYGSARTWARRLGNQELCALLQQTLDEEGQTDEKLTRIAESSVNQEAAHGERMAA